MTARHNETNGHLAKERERTRALQSVAPVRLSCNLQLATQSAWLSGRVCFGPAGIRGNNRGRLVPRALSQMSRAHQRYAPETSRRPPGVQPIDNGRALAFCEWPPNASAPIHHDKAGDHFSAGRLDGWMAGRVRQSFLLFAFLAITFGPPDLHSEAHTQTRRLTRTPQLAVMARGGEWASRAHARRDATRISQCRAAPRF